MASRSTDALMNRRMRMVLTVLVFLSGMSLLVNNAATDSLESTVLYGIGMAFVFIAVVLFTAQFTGKERPTAHDQTKQKEQVGKHVKQEQRD